MIRLEGRTVYLRDLVVQDVTDSYKAWMNDPEVTQFLEVRFKSHNASDICYYIQETQKKKDVLFLAIIKKENDQHIGNIKIGPVNPHHKFADVGIMIGDKPSWGKGYATEAIQLASQYAFENGVHRLQAGAYEDNVGSWKAFEKAGYQIESRELGKWLYKDRYVDGIVLTKIRP